MAYQLVALARVTKDLDRTPPRIRNAIRVKLEELAADPSSARLDIKPLRAIDSKPPILRLRLANYRVLFQVDPDKHRILILRIGPRKTVYRGLVGLDP